MINRRARIRALERAYAPGVLSNFRFISHIVVAPDDPWCGQHADLRIAGSPIGEVIVYASTRAGYVAQRESLRHKFVLLEG